MTATDNDLLKILAGLDVENEEHWTDDGLPAMAQFADLDPKPTRKEVTELAPAFSRKHLELPGDEPVASPPPLASLPPPTDTETEDEESTEDRIAYLEEHLADARHAKAQVLKAIEEISKELEAARVAHDLLHPPMSHAKMVKLASMSTQKAREEQAAKNLFLKKLVGNPDALADAMKVGD